MGTSSDGGDVVVDGAGAGAWCVLGSYLPRGLRRCYHSGGGKR